MIYRSLLVLFSVLMGNVGFTQTSQQSAIEEAKNIKVYLDLTSVQEDSLEAALPVYYTFKKSFLQKKDRIAVDTKSLQKLHDDILRRILTDEQYQRYEAVKQQHLQLLKQRMRTPDQQ